MRGSQILGIIMAVILIAFGVAYPVPKKYVDVSSNSTAYHSSWSKNIGAEYLGGDCYNYQVEASLKAGYLTGVLAMKSITFVGGLLLLFLTLYFRIRYQTIEAQTRIITEMAKDSKKSLEKLSDNSDEHAVILNALLSTLDKGTAPDEENSSKEEISNGR